MIHVGSGVDKEVNHALELLSSLLDADLKAMTRFTVIIKVFFMPWWAELQRHTLVVVFVCV